MGLKIFGFQIGSALSKTSIAAVFISKGFATTQGRSVINGASNVAAGLRAVGLSVIANNSFVSSGTITIDSVVTRSGNVFTFTARRTTNLSSAEDHVVSIAGSTIYLPGAIAADFGGIFPTTTVHFVAGSATASFTITSPIAQPE